MNGQYRDRDCGSAICPPNRKRNWRRYAAVSHAGRHLVIPNGSSVSPSNSTSRSHCDREADHASKKTKVPDTLFFPRGFLFLLGFTDLRSHLDLPYYHSIGAFQRCNRFSKTAYVHALVFEIEDRFSASIRLVCCRYLVLYRSTVYVLRPLADIQCIQIRVYEPIPQLFSLY